MSKRTCTGIIARKEGFKERKFSDSIGLRFEDYHHKIEEEIEEIEKRKSSKKTKEDVQNFSTFKLMNPKETKLVLYDYEKSDAELDAEFTLPFNNFNELVDYIYDAELIDELVDYNIGVKLKLPSILYHATKGCS
jgi:hypothetical protein